MSQYRFHGLTLCLLFTLAACGDPAGPNTDTRIANWNHVKPAGPLTIDVEPDTVYVTRYSNVSYTSIQFEVSLTIRNYSDHDMTLGRCGAYLQRKEGDTWQTAWVPACAAVLMPPDILNAGYEREHRFPVWAALSGNAGPKWKAENVAGVYRVVYYAWREKTSLPGPGSAMEVYSKTFTLVDAPR